MTLSKVAYWKYFLENSYDEEELKSILKDIEESEGVMAEYSRELSKLRYQESKVKFKYVEYREKIRGLKLEIKNELSNFYTTKEAANRLGVNIPKMHRLKEKYPCIQFRGDWFFHKEEIDDDMETTQ
tara:strand:- start:4624 stop:5004 length:381 start_codon:yes stop_codon:yes gene_type:complete